MLTSLIQLNSGTGLRQLSFCPKNINPPSRTDNQFRTTNGESANNKKLKPSEDPAYFEYETHEGDVSDEEMCGLLYTMEKAPEDIKDPVFKEKYLVYIEAQQK